VLALVERGLLEVPFQAGPEAPAIRHLMQRYRSVPMAFADACLVRMAELDDARTVLTLDGAFRIFRKHVRQRVPVVLPEGR
jgi:hypothetical protein